MTAADALLTANDALLTADDFLATRAPDTMIVADALGRGHFAQIKDNLGPDSDAANQRANPELTVSIKQGPGYIYSSTCKKCIRIYTKIPLHIGHKAKGNVANS